MAQSLMRELEVNFEIYKDSEELAQNACEYLIERIGAILEKKEVVRIAVSGGSTPKRTFQLLSDPEIAPEVPWEKTEWYFVDERNVDPSSDESNYKMFKTHLLDGLSVTPKVVRIQGELPPAEAAVLYSKEITENMNLAPGEMPTFDLLLLGMGADGHTASLFPHSKGLHVEDEIAIANFAPELEVWRITLTKTAINNANEVIFLISGKDKSETLKEVVFGDYNPELYPTTLIRPKNNTLLFLLDEAASAEVERYNLSDKL